MDIRDSSELMKKYGDCPECGNDKVGGGMGSLIIEDEIFTRSCRCGWSVTVDKRIKVIATATKKIGRKTDGIFEIKIHGTPKHKYLPLNELKEMAGAKRINQVKKIEYWLNTVEGRKWAIETPHVENF